MIPSLEEVWREMVPGGGTPAFRRVDEHHPLDLYIGIALGGSRVLLLLTEQEPPAELVQARGFEVESGKRADGRWALTVRLRMPELSRLFAHLCEDLVDASRSGCQPSGAGRFVLDRIARWERLLARGHGAGLDERSFRGLVAELAVLRRLLIPVVGPGPAIASWVGPLDADQDFRLEGRLVEVKSTTVGSMTVTISSAEQLDVYDFPLTLVAVPVGSGDGPPGSDGTLGDLVTAIRESAADEAATVELFEERLTMTGYDPDDEFCRRSITIGPMRSFRIARTFPSIVRSSLDAAVRSVRYELDLGLCRNFEVPGIFE